MDCASLLLRGKCEADKLFKPIYFSTVFKKNEKIRKNRGIFKSMKKYIIWFRKETPSWYSRKRIPGSLDHKTPPKIEDLLHYYVFPALINGTNILPKFASDSYTFLFPVCYT